MKYVIKAIVLLLFLSILYSVTEVAEAAKLKKIIIVRKGRAIQISDVEEMGVFVSLVGKNGVRSAINEDSVSTGDEVYVETGANLLMNYKGNDLWLGYDTHARVGPRKLEGLKGKFYVLGSDGFFDFSKIRVAEAGSQYYVEVNEGGKSILYVVEGYVKVKTEDAESPIHIKEKHSIIDGKPKDLPERDVARILRWRDRLMFPPIPITLPRKPPASVPEKIAQWIAGNPWPAAGITVGTVGGVLALGYLAGDKEQSDLHVTVRFDLP